ncbi:MAG: SLBB domain-containing protein [Rubricoccaceae bacterium]|nr:SLBB domain-containing protein [Rubricoccaceae bacterium]
MHSLHRAVVLLALAFLLASPVAAQVIGVGNPLLNGIQQRTASVLPTNQPVPLEGPLDGNNYYVGPGDVFSIGIGGQLAITQRSVVTADGILIIPELGSFDVADRTLNDVTQEVTAALRRRFANVETTIALAEPRQFYVHVSGAGLDPGRHLMVPVSRVEDAIVAAMGGVSPQRLRSMTPARQALAVRVMQATEAATLEPGSVQPRDALLPPTSYEPAFRNVLVTHRDGTSERVDLLRYYATGSTDSNPYLRDGDAVFLPFYNPEASSVGVHGAVAEPGVFDYRPDDTALSVLTLVMGPDVEHAPNDFRLLRVVDGRVTSTMLHAEDLAHTPLQSGDRLHVLPVDETIGSAAVDGAVFFAGSFPIEAGRTTLRDLIEMAGGLKPDALVRGAYLERTAQSLPPKNATTVNAAQMAVDPTLEAEFREAALAATAFDHARLSTFDYVERQYLAREYLGFQRVSMNLAASLRDEAEPIYLENGDRLVIPYDLGGIYVFGQVLNPGYIPYTQGQSVEEYIQLAGGRSPSATETYVIDASSGAIVLAPEHPAVRSGDFIFVNRKAYADDRLTQQLIVQQEQLAVQQRRESNDSRWRSISSILQAASLVVSVIAILTR